MIERAKLAYEVVDAAPAIVWATSADGRLMFMSRGWYAFTGQTESEAFGDDGLGWLGAVHPDDRAGAAGVFLEANSTGRPFSLDYRLRRADGVYRWAIDAGNPRFDANHQFIGYSGTVIDVHERKLAETAARVNGERFHTLFERMDQGFCILQIVTDGADHPVDYRIIEGNPAFERYTGLRGFSGRLVKGDLVPQIESFWIETYGRVALTGEEARFEHRAAALDGGWFEVHAFRVGEPSARRVAVFFKNVKEQKQAEDERRRLAAAANEARVAAEAASAAKDRFLAVLSHELRTPLTPVLMALTEMEGRADLPGDVRESLAMIMRNVQVEVKLIDDLLDLNRIASGKVRLERERVDIGVLVRECCQIVKPLLHERGLKLVCDAPSGAGLVEVDAVRMRQVFWNLLINAAKFTPPGGEVTVSVTSDGDGMVSVMVRDTGVGIPPDLLTRMFDAFEQGDATACGQSGLGLGLAIAKAIVELHGGTISAHSGGRDTGATFTVELPGFLRWRGDGDRA